MAEIIYQASDSPTLAITNTFDVAKKSNLNLDIGYQKTWWGTLKGLWVYFNTAASSPTAISIMITQDALGDRVIVPETASAISFGLTSAAQGAAVWAVDLPLKMSTENLYVFIKTDTGTITVNEVVLSWLRDQ